MNWRLNKKVAGSSALLVLCAAAPGLALAQMDFSNVVHETYVGIGAGQSKDRDIPGGGDDTDTGWKAFVGWDVNKILGLEAGYVDLGKFTDGVGSEVKAHGWNIDARAGIPFYNQKASVFIKGGTYRANVDVSTPLASSSQSKWDWTYGVGAEYDFTQNFGARAEWERFKLKNDLISDQNTDLLSASLVWKFK